MTIINSATDSELPIKPNKKMIVLLSSLAGLIISILLTIFINLFKSKQLPTT